MKIVVTGGHLTPAIAVIAQLRKLNNKCQFYFFGRKSATEGDDSPSFEYLEIKNAGIPFFDITTGRLQRKLTKHSFFSLVKIVPGLVKSLALLRKIRPQLVVTFGGYVALPVAIAAYILRIPSVAHEQTPKLGLANKIIFKFSKLKGISYQSLAKEMPDSKTIFTGPLLREEIFRTEPRLAKLANFLKKSGASRLIYITGGATGSHFINQIMISLIPEILQENFVIHQTGNLAQSLDFRKLTRFKDSLPQNLQEKYFLTEFVNSKNFGAVISRADLVICRSGANITFELQALAKVAIVIPLAWGVEQKEIATNLTKAGAVLVIPQNQATSKRVRLAIKNIFENYQKFERCAAIWRRKIPATGATIFAKKILEIG